MFIVIAVLCIVITHTTARPSDDTKYVDETGFVGTPKNCSVQAWNEQFEKVEERLMNATNDEQYPSDGNAEGSDVPLSSNPGLHSNPVVHCQQETVVHDKDFGSGIRMRTNSTISTESYRSNTYHHKGDVGSEDFAKQFGFF